MHFIVERNYCVLPQQAEDTTVTLLIEHITQCRVENKE